MCISELLEYCIYQVCYVAGIFFLGSEHTFINKTKIPILFLHGETKS